MARRSARDFDPRILEIFDGYVHGRITKREFMSRAGKYAAAGVTGAALLEQLRPNYALAQQVAPDDPGIETETVSYESPEGTGTISGLMARPVGAEGPLPAVLVIHENRGLNPYIEDVVRRAAKAGFLAFGPDGLSSLGGYPGTDEEGREMQASLDGAALMEDFFAAFEFLRDHRDTTGRVGAVGFCYGGGVCNALAVAYPDLAASAPFYGRQPAASDVPAIEAPLMIHYAGPRRPDQRGLGALRRGAGGERQAVLGALLPGREPRLPQRHHAALRRGGGLARLGAHAGLLRRVRPTGGVSRRTPAFGRRSAARRPQARRGVRSRVPPPTWGAPTPSMRAHAPTASDAP